MTEELNFYLILIYLNKHMWLEADILSSADAEQWFSTLAAQWITWGDLKSTAACVPIPRDSELISWACVRGTSIFSSSQVQPSLRTAIVVVKNMNSEAR